MFWRGLDYRKKNSENYVIKYGKKKKEKESILLKEISDLGYLNPRFVHFRINMFFIGLFVVCAYLLVDNFFCNFFNVIGYLLLLLLLAEGLLATTYY